MLCICPNNDVLKPAVLKAVHAFLIICTEIFASAFRSTDADSNLSTFSHFGGAKLPVRVRTESHLSLNFPETIKTRLQPVYI